jgi:hypothetical protein
MSITQKLEQFESIESPEEGDFIWPPDIKWQIHEILEINQGDFDEQITELARINFPWVWEWFSKRENWYTVKNFWTKGFIRLLESENDTIEIDLIQLEGKWIKALLEIFLYSIENNFKIISLKVQPQKKPSPRRKKILYDFYSNFGFSWSDWTNMSLSLTKENKKVLVNKIKYYLENGKWFKS